jgi:hypothetical protein
MPVTLSYDLQDATPNQRNYVRSALERCGWKRLGGSVFRYDGLRPSRRRPLEEDWLNEVIPSLMFFRSYILNHGLTLRFFTLDAASVARIDHSDPALLLGRSPLSGGASTFHQPTNPQSAIGTLRAFIDAAAAAT